MSSYRFTPTLSQVGADQALAFWHSSAHASPFTHPAVLGRLSPHVAWWQASVNGEALCMWPAPIAASGAVLPPEFSYFVGPLWAPSLAAASPRRALYAQTSIIDAMVELLVREYGRFRLDLHPDCLDVRGFDWWSRSRPGCNGVQIRPRYTACIEDLQRQSDDEILSRYANTRRNRVRAIARTSNPRACAWRMEDLIDMYGKLMDRQGVPELAHRREPELIALCELVAEGYGFVHAAAMADDRPQGLRLVLTSPRRACDVLSISDSIARDEQLMPWMFHEAVLASKRAGCAVHDFNGANSLHRSSFVHSFGATAALYFRIEYTA